MGLGKTNKRKGSDAERYYANQFKEIGFTHCLTSRLGSRQHDNAKIDLVFIPFNVQIKSGVQKNMNPGKELTLMKDAVTKMFPQTEDIHNKPYFLIHKKVVGTGKKRTPFHEVVYMSQKQFEQYIEKGCVVEIVYEKTYKFETISEFKTVVGITFQCFIEKIVKPLYLET